MKADSDIRQEEPTDLRETPNAKEEEEEEKKKETPDAEACDIKDWMYPNCEILINAKTSVPIGLKSYAFQAQIVFVVRNAIVLKKCLIGGVNYGNTIMKILCGIKVEDWLFCAETNGLMPEKGRQVLVGAFRGPLHFSFGPLALQSKIPSPQSAVGALGSWVIRNVLPLYYNADFSEKTFDGSLGSPSQYNTLPVFDTEEVGCLPLSRKEIVPNLTSASAFLEANENILPKIEPKPV